MMVHFIYALKYIVYSVKRLKTGNWLMANTFKGAFLYCIKLWACSSVLGNKRNIIQM